MMGRGSSNITSRTGQDREECFDDNYFPCRNQSVIDAAYV
jgi:hypothetical protein